MGKLREQYKAWQAAKAQWKDNEKQRLLTMSEKELLVEIALELKEINGKCDAIQRKQVIFSD